VLKGSGGPIDSAENGAPGTPGRALLDDEWARADQLAARVG